MTAPQRYLLDSDVFIEWTRSDKGSARVREWINRILPRFRVLCPVALAEALRGIDNAPSRPAKRRELREVRKSRKWEWVDIRDQTAATWAAMMQVAPPGQGQPNNDSWLAAIARRHGFTVLTRNRRHLVAYGVATADPWKDPFPAT